MNERRMLGLKLYGAEDTAIEDADDEQDGLPSREGRA